ncbi:hypothetical protein Tco_0634826 [Tanacetum coccineum]
MQQPMPNPKDITDPTTAMNMIAQPGINLGQDNQMHMFRGNGGISLDSMLGQKFGEFMLGLGHLARNCTVRPRRRDVVYLQTQLLIAQKEEARIQLHAEEFDLMAAAANLDEIKEFNANCILMANLQQSIDIGVEQGGGTVEQHSATVEETPVYHESLFYNLAAEVEKVNSINRKMKETNVELTTKLARYKNQEKCFEISQEKYDKLERCYQQSVYQEQRLTKKINTLHLSSGKQITTLNEEISNLNKQLSKEKSTVSSLQEEKKRLKYEFKIREDKLLDKQIQLENKIKELDNILKQQSLYNGKVLLEKHDPPAVYDSEETLELAQEKADESLSKYKALELEIERLLRAFVSQDIMSIVQNNSVVDTSNLQTKLERTKERFENCIIKKENEEENSMPNKPIKASFRTNPFTISEPHVITKKVVNSDSNGFFSTGVDITTKTRRPQPRSNTKNDRVPSASKSSRIKNKGIEVEEHPRNLLLSKNKKNMSS